MIINEKYVKLRKNQAVRWHRRMWNWIAEQIRDGAELVPILLKRKFMRKHHITSLKNSCFCCDFVGGALCYRCPIAWENRMCTVGEYVRFQQACKLGDREEAYRLARAIARLPKREVR